MSNDVLLIPVSTVQVDLVTQTDKLVHVPLASKVSHGIVRIGEGLNITSTGELSLDESVVDSKVELIDKKTTEHINDYSNPHKVTKDQVGLGEVNNTSDVDKPVSTATRNELLRLENMISGARAAIVYETYRDMVNALNATSNKEYVVGMSILIGDVEVPDLWIYGISQTSEPYDYIDDKTIITSLKDNTTIKVGYYVLAQLESTTIILDNVVTTNTEQTIIADKIFKANLEVVPNNTSEFFIRDDLFQMRVDTKGTSLFQVRDNGASILAYDKSSDKTAGLSVMGDGVQLIGDAFTYNGKQIATVDDIGGLEIVWWGK